MKIATELFTHAIYERKKVFIEAILASFFLNFLGVATALYSMQIYDRVVPNNAMSTLWVLSIGVTIAIIFEFILRQARAIVVERAYKSVDMELSDFFFSHAINIQMMERPSTVGAFASQLKMYEYVRNFMTSTTLFLFADVPFALVFVFIIFLIAGPLAIIPLFLIPLMVLSGFLFIKPIARISEESSRDNNEKNGILIESIDAIETIKSLKAESHYINKWNGINQRAGEFDIKIKNYTLLSNNLSQLIQQITYVSIVGFGVYLISEGDISMGALIAVTIIAGRALSPLSQIANVMVQWQQAKAALSGLESIVNAKVDGQLPYGLPLVKPEVINGEIQLSEVEVAFNDVRTLHIPNLIIPKGARVGVIGGIGSGKSTLLKVLSGLWKPTRGRAFLSSMDMSHLDPNILRDNVFYLAQDSRLFSGTLKDNLTVGLSKKPSDDQLLAIAKETGLDKLIHYHPRGMGLMIDEGGKGLSGGQRQLLSITRMLLRKPKVMLLDEPTAALDGQTEVKAMQAISNHLEKDQTFVLVTHKLSLLDYVDLLIVVEKGQVVMYGPKKEVLSRLNGGK